MPEAKIKPYSIKEMAAMYGVSHRVFMRWLTQLSGEDTIELRHSRTFTPKQVSIIFDNFGIPEIK